MTNISSIIKLAAAIVVCGGTAYAADLDTEPAPDTAAAADEPVRASGYLFRSIFGDTLEKDYGIGIVGWGEATAIYGSSHNRQNLANGAFLTQEMGVNLNQIGLMICRNAGCLPTGVFPPAQNLLSRIGPLPGPRGGFDIGFNATVMWGEDIQFLRTAGVDDFTFDDDEDNKLAFPQFYVDAYIPVLDGMTIMAGSFFTFVGNEVGSPFTPPNWFVTHTYGLQHGPSKHVGGLASIKIPTPQDFGLLSFDAGLTAGWNNWDESRPTVLGAARWRSPDLATWLDFEFVYGDGEEDNFGPAAGGSPYIAISTTDENLDRFHASFTATHQATAKLQLAFEGLYGFQEGGDAAPVPIAITEDSEWYGVNIGGRYKLADDLHLAGRAEWFRDEKAANVLWSSVGATGGDVYSLTANLDWQVNPFMRVRPEVRYDTYTGDGTGLFGDGTEDDQFIALFSTNVNF